MKKSTASRNVSSAALSPSLAAVLVLGSAFALAGCSDEKDEAGGFDNDAMTSSLFLTAAELETKNTKVVDADSVTFEVNGLSDLYANEPEAKDKDEDESEDKAWDACFEKNIKGKIVADGKNYKMEFTASPFECVLGKETKIKFDEYRFSFHGQCEEMTENGKALDGKSFAQTVDDEFAPGEDVCVFGKENRYVMQSKFKITSSAELEGTKYTSKSTLVDSTSASDGSPCVEVNNTTADCVTTSVASTEVNNGGKVTKEVKRTVLAMSDTKVSKAGQKFYEAGTVKITLADWAGSAKYTAADKAPAWTLKKGSATKTGTFGVDEKPDSADLVFPSQNVGLRPSDILRLAKTKALRALPARQ
jgi:hypothetical protein